MGWGWLDCHGDSAWLEETRLLQNIQSHHRLTTSLSSPQHFAMYRTRWKGYILTFRKLVSAWLEETRLLPNIRRHHPDFYPALPLIDELLVEILVTHFVQKSTYCMCAMETNNLYTTLKKWKATLFLNDSSSIIIMMIIIIMIAVSYWAWWPAPLAGARPFIVVATRLARNSVN